MKPFIVTQWDLATEPSGGVWLDGPDKRHFFPYGTSLFTADQLRKAQVAILRKAAEQWIDEPGEDAYSFLRRMADELEFTSPTPHNQHEVDDTARKVLQPQTPNA